MIRLFMMQAVFVLGQPYILDLPFCVVSLEDAVYMK